MDYRLALTLMSIRQEQMRQAEHQRLLRKAGLCLPGRSFRRRRRFLSRLGGMLVVLGQRLQTCDVPPAVSFERSATESV
jgi:hypothetical protein